MSVITYFRASHKKKDIKKFVKQILEEKKIYQL